MEPSGVDGGQIVVTEPSKRHPSTSSAAPEDADTNRMTLLIVKLKKLLQDVEVQAK